MSYNRAPRLGGLICNLLLVRGICSAGEATSGKHRLSPQDLWISRFLEWFCVGYTEETPQCLSFKEKIDLVHERSLTLEQQEQYGSLHSQLVDSSMADLPTQLPACDFESAFPLGGLTHALSYCTRTSPSTNSLRTQWKLLGGDILGRRREDVLSTGDRYIRGTGGQRHINQVYLWR
ncbi:hypothetical protein DL95DRAFT_409587 [Leptodontidium sp. 2 PMI_412]|nr:hypothetical protein DL95DRAFT_409587 [Leptodontidium sp. 2 PMI_412]